MIIVQDILAKGFNMMPEVGGFKATYNWGTKEHLLRVLELFQDNNQSPYPLIYQVSNTSTQRNQSNDATVQLELILAVRETDVSMLNEVRWEKNYKQLLYPVINYITQLFSKGANAFTWDGEYTIMEYPNYGEGNQNYTIDLWDALRFETTITIKNNCINDFLYDTIQ